MNISPEEAKRTLEQVDAAAQSTKVVAALAGTDIAVMTWGLILMLGYAWCHVVATSGMNGNCYAVFLLLAAIGFAVSFLVEWRYDPVRNPVEKRLGMFWFAMYAYVLCVMAIIGPFLNNKLPGSAHDPAKAIAAVNTIIPMFAYVVMGLWLEQKHFILAGLGLTAVTLLTYFTFNSVFFIVMAVAGGGLLFGYGVWMRVSWQRAVRRMGQRGQV